jgi:hypothetical protein
LVAVSTPDYSGLTRQLWSVPSNRERLEIIASNRRGWQWSSLWWAAGSVLNVLGFGLLAVMMHQAGGSLLGEAATLSFLLAAALWIVAMAYRMSVETMVIGATDEASELPNWFKPLEAWSITIMLIYMGLGYFATALLGWALLQTAVLASWIGWLSLLFGTAAALLIVSNRPRYPGTDFSIAGLPILLHMMPLIIGVALLER